MSSEMFFEHVEKNMLKENPFLGQIYLCSFVSVFCSVKCHLINVELNLSVF